MWMCEFMPTLTDQHIQIPPDRLRAGVSYYAVPLWLLQVAVGETGACPPHGASPPTTWFSSRDRWKSFAMMSSSRLRHSNIIKNTSQAKWKGIRSYKITFSHHVSKYFFFPFSSCNSLQTSKQWFQLKCLFIRFCLKYNAVISFQFRVYYGLPWHKHENDVVGHIRPICDGVCSPYRWIHPGQEGGLAPC